jgi:diamine N-acetyltransferase
LVTEITIRRITLNDVAALAAISRQTFYDTFTGTCTETDMEDFLEAHYNERQITKELRNPNDFYFFAEADGKPVGYIRFIEEYSNFDVMKKWKALELKRIYVVKEYHGKGVAQKLMDFVIDFAVKEKYEVIWLGVWEHNIKAQKFYEKYGFVNSGHTHNFPIGSTPQTDFWFWKFL